MWALSPRSSTTSTAMPAGSVATTSSRSPGPSRRSVASKIVAGSLRAETGRRVSYEWAMIGGVNDSDQDAAELAGVARSAEAHVNLIPLNATPGYPTTGSGPQRVKEFARQLRHRGINVTIRTTMGDDIDAACGQLATRHA